MRIQHGMSEAPVTAAAATDSSVECTGKEPELRESGKRNRKKAICVMRARQERTGILYIDRRLVKKPEDVLSVFGKLFDRAGVDSCMVSVPEILKLALLSNCPSFPLVHNHPSGDSSPSEEDRAITERVEKAAEIVGIRMVEHLIVGDMRNGYSIKYEQKVHLPEADPEKAGEIRNGIRGTDSGQESCAKQKACREKKGA